MDWTERFFEGPWQEEYLEYAADAARTAREAEFIAAELALEAGQYVLDLACGSGRHALALAARGVRVLGLDLTPRFLAAAREAAAAPGSPAPQFRQGDMRELDFRAEFDAAYNYFTAWGYHSDAENFDVLARVRRALKPGGSFLLETINRDGLMRGYRQRDYQLRADGVACLEERRFELSEGRAYNRRLYLHPDGRREEFSFDHYLPTSDALLRHMRDAGFATARVVEAPTGQPLTIDSWRMAVIATA